MWLEKLSSGGGADQRDAAYHLFVENPNSVKGNGAAAEALQQILETPEPPPAAILLAAIASSDGAVEAIKKHKRESGDQRVKLHPWSHPVPLKLVADLALSRLGDEDGRSDLRNAIDSGNTDERTLILDAIEMIDEPTLLHQLDKYLNDETEISRGVPSGAEPKRRLQDYAVDQLVNRLHLAVSFAVNTSGRYSSEQIQETRKLLRNSIPS